MFVQYTSMADIHTLHKYAKRIQFQQKYEPVKCQVNDIVFDQLVFYYCKKKKSSIFVNITTVAQQFDVKVEEIMCWFGSQFRVAHSKNELFGCHTAQHISISLRNFMVCKLNRHYF
jgi:hypothetical protein